MSHVTTSAPSIAWAGLAFHTTASTSTTGTAPAAFEAAKPTGVLVPHQATFALSTTARSR
ncbi:hypothetical protein [Streptomyces sp. NPDC004533]|uniref:hypothetical protein n=1 Tax=Streptomyces sp. NPDC004533 TaxID=3154278 RepID=UPI0033B1CF79